MDRREEQLAVLRVSAPLSSFPTGVPMLVSSKEKPASKASLKTWVECLQCPRKGRPRVPPDESAPRALILIGPARFQGNTVPVHVADKSLISAGHDCRPPGLTPLVASLPSSELALQVSDVRQEEREVLGDILSRMSAY